MRISTAVVFGLICAAGGTVETAGAQPVKIGVLNDQSGLYADLTGMGSVRAARMAVEDFGGKVLGRPIEVIFADHQNKPDVGSTIARQWIENDGVSVILDIPNSAVGLAVREVTRTRDAVDINTGAASSDLSGKACSPHGIHWTFDTYGLAAGTGRALVKQGGDTWFFITADYLFGHSIERDTGDVVRAAGGKVLGAARAPLNNADFSSFLLQAQASKAKVIGMANGGADTINTIKQASEFGIVAGGQNLAGIVMFISDIHSLGLKLAQGLIITEAYYWDLNDKTRAFGKRFFERMKRMPTMNQAATYSATLHYLNAVKAAGTKETRPVLEKMRATPVRDAFTDNGVLREDGRMVHSMFLFEVKKPEESRAPWDYYKVLAEVPGDQAFRPMKDGGCPLIK
jgi:branched-chain amino acid transport system substrate-binding protein